MRNGWTGGQYSLYRVVFGGYLAVHFLHLLPWATELFSRDGVLGDGTASPFLHLFPNVLALVDAPWAVTALLGLGVAGALFFAAGAFDRIAAVVCWYVLACLFGRNPLIANPSLPFVGWLLIAHCFVPRAPYGAWAARGRTDPDGGWRLPDRLFLAAWIVLAVGYGYSGYTKLVSPSWRDGTAFAHVLENPLARPTFLREWLLAAPPLLLKAATWGGLALELAFAPLVLVRKLRPFLWLAMVGMHLGLLVLIDFADLTAGMLVVHLFTFDPAWVPGTRAAKTETMFFDGSCGLCHRAVRFVLAEDRRDGTPLEIAPLGGERFRELLGDREEELPDSVVVVDGEASVLVRSNAILHLMGRLGGLWRVLAAAARIVPRPVRDLAYDGIAKVRRKLFARPKDECPLLPAALRARFKA